MTVISPNIVELVGNLQQQFGAPRAKPPPSRPPFQTPSGNSAENRNGQRAEAGARPLTAVLRRSDIGNRQDRSPRRNPFRPDLTTTRPSAQFLTQLIGQQSAAAPIVPKRHEAGIAAYNKRANTNPSRSPEGIVFLTRRVDTLV
jgi:hypothetical protein